MTNKLAFKEACRRVVTGGRLVKGIGTMGEGTVHAVLKNYYEPFLDSQERSIGGYVADIVGEDGIIEIQTGNFSRLRKKLPAFLGAARVTVVYPVYTKKRIVTLDSTTYEIKSRRTSPLKGSPYDIFTELFPISEFLTNEMLSIRIVMLECDEYRISPESLGKRKNRYGRLSVCDRVPTALVDEILISCPDDWAILIPCLFEKDHTSAELAAAAHISPDTARTALAALYRGGILERTGKKGNAYTYSLVTAR